jgi:hypothetical protein
VDVLLDPIQRRLSEVMALDPPPIRVSAVGRESVVLGGLAAGLDVARNMVLEQIEV